MTHKTHGIRLVRRWHARVGMVALLFLLFLVLSGLVLNHGDTLGLDAVEIRQPWLMNWYGLKAVIPAGGYPAGDGFLAWGGGKWALSGRVVATKAANPVGAVEVGGIDYVATRSGLYLYRPDGRLVDKVENRSLPGLPVARLGKAGERVVLDTAEGAFASRDGVEWEKADASSAAWSELRPIPPEEKQKLVEALAPGLPLQRVLLDLHSGRIFGRYGPWVVDLLACSLLGLGLSGLWMYWRAIRR